MPKFSDPNTLRGRERTTDDFEALYAEAGFRLDNVIHTASPFAIIEGVPL